MSGWWVGAGERVGGCRGCVHSSQVARWTHHTRVCAGCVLLGDVDSVAPINPDT